MQKLTIHGRLANLNDYTLACRGDYGKYKGNNLKKKQEMIVKQAIATSGLVPIKNYPIKMKYLWVEENKKRDLDNIAFGKKFIQDGLVDEGIIENDGWKQISGFSDEFDIDKENPRIEIEIYEAGEY